MYFSKFPALYYPLPFANGVKSVLCRNILRRCALAKDMANSDAIYIQYDIKDGERPEHIADRLYGDPELHWLILFANNIIDPYNEWYKSSSVFTEYVHKKYNSISLFFTDMSDKMKYIPNIAENSTITQGSAPNITKGVISNYRPSFSCIDVSKLSFAVGDASIQNPNTNESSGIKITKKISSLDAIHHFETTNLQTDTLDPFSLQDPKSLIEKYIKDNPLPLSVSVVSNLVYEQRKNENRRTIKILHPSYKDKAMKNLQSSLEV